MRYSDLLESTHIFLHASRADLPNGAILRPGGNNLLDGDIEEVLEKNRPESKPSRHESVFMAPDMRTLEDLTVFTDANIYQVTPSQPLVRVDHEWINKLWRLFAEHENDMNDTVLVHANILARRYWSGRPASGRPIWEYLAPAAVVDKRIQSLSENAEMVNLTPKFVAAVRAKAKQIAWDIAEDLPKKYTDFAARLQELLKTIHAIGGIGPTMHVARAELRPRRQIPAGITSVGCHWAWDANLAKVYHDDNAYEDAEREGYSRDDLVEITLIATVKFRDVDWIYTLATNLIHPGEREITIRPGVDVHLEEIWADDIAHDVNQPAAVTGYLE